MNILVTNTRNSQAYSIVRALRPHAKKIVATMEGDNRASAWLSHAARSRLVDKRYFTPSPASDWRAGRVQKENTEKEENYLQVVLRICEQEKIDTIFPSFDPHVYVFAKNKERFEKRGILIPVPDYETVITPLDKYRTIRAAEESGFPCPRTFLPGNEENIKRVAEELGFPLILKRRFTAASRGMFLVKDLTELSDKARFLEENSGNVLVQEFIPSSFVDDISITLNKNAEPIMLFCRDTFCHSGRFHQIYALAQPDAHAYTKEAARMIQKLGWFGGITVQTRIDSRDNTPKLMEINPRIGSGLWRRITVGINEPLMILKIAKGEEVEPIRHYPVGTVFADPIEHGVHFVVALVDWVIYNIRTRLLRKAPLDSHRPAMSLGGLFQSIRKTYFSGEKRVYSPYTKYFFRDPLASLIWWMQFIIHWWIRNLPRELGR